MLTAGRPEALRVALLTSRRAPGLDRLLARSHRPGAGWHFVAAVVSDPASEALPLLAEAHVPAYVHDLRAFCAERGTRLGDRASRREYDQHAASLLAPHRVINIHDSDLMIPGPCGRPFYRGLRSTRDAVANGEPETRSTVHVVTEDVDVGPLLVRSWGFPVHPLVEEARDWKAEDIISAYAYAQREWMMRSSWGRLLERAIEHYARGEVHILDGKAVVAGTLGPEELAPLSGPSEFAAVGRAS
jgi:folate-dependent phosphoribosylglycinamide formyltransferase PurN